MARQVFSQWLPVAKAQNEQGQEVYLPFAGIHVQTRDGNDEVIVGAGNMVWTGSMWVPVSDQNRLPVEATLTGRTEEVTVLDSLSLDPGTNYEVVIPNTSGFQGMSLHVEGTLSKLSVRLYHPSITERKSLPLYNRAGVPMSMWDYAPNVSPVYVSETYYANIGTKQRVSIRVSSPQDLTITAVLYEHPFPLSPAVEWGTMFGWRQVTPSDGLVVGPFYTLIALTNCTLHSDTRFNAEVRQGKATQGLGGVTIPAGVQLPGPYERVRLTEGQAVVYFA